MLNIITVFLDLLFPPRDTELCIRKLSDNITSLIEPGTYNEVTYITSYKNPLIKALIKENKYHHNEASSRALASLVESHLAKTKAEEVVLIPIPQSKGRARERGHNQVETILSHLAKSERISVRTDILSKSRHTPTQTSLSLSERKKNVDDSFTCNSKTSKEIPQSTTIIIVDDVVTTGVTLKAARASLAPHLPTGTTITLLAIAH